MGEVAVMNDMSSSPISSEQVLLHHSDSKFKPPLSPNIFIHIPTTTSSLSTSSSSDQSNDDDGNNNNNEGSIMKKDSWLPITESRKGNAYYAAFHVINSNIAFQALMLPFPFLTLGWVWGSVCLLLAFVWQFYTVILLLRLHESVPGIRYSRFLFLAMAAFGKRLGKLAALFPVMYLSGGSCVILIITGGGTMQSLFNTLCPPYNTCHAHALTGLQWFLLFTAVAVVLALLLPNLNSVAAVSLVGAVAVVSYCTLFWVLSVVKGRPTPLSYASSLTTNNNNNNNNDDGYSSVDAKVASVFNAVGTIFVSFRGHNLLLEIQGTLPSSAEVPSMKLMRKGVSIAYVIIAMCVFPLAIAGFWAYGNKFPSEGGLLTAFPEFHRHQVTKFSMGFLYMLVILHCLTSFQIYAMPVFDNLELRYIGIKKKPCSKILRSFFRLLFGGLTFFIAVAFPFLPKLAALLGGMTLLPLTYAYPCFMWVAMKRPSKGSFVWWFNVGLGCFGMGLSGLVVVGAIWTLVHKHFHANFLKP